MLFRSQPVIAVDYDAVLLRAIEASNPLGTHAMYLGSTLYRIHGSPDADSVGEA